MARTILGLLAALLVIAPAAFAQIPPSAICPNGGNCDSPAPCGNAKCLDQDHDGLCDSWEVAGGIDLNGDGEIDDENDLPLPGARPDRPDIYLQYDWMVLPGPNGHSHEPSRAAIRAVVQAFARQGIALHVRRGHRLPHYSVVTPDPVDPACAGNDAVNFSDLKARYFDPRRALAYHYAVFGHYNTCDSGVGCGLCQPATGFGGGGRAELPGNDLMVTLGVIFDILGRTPTTENEAGVFMHELGHNFGLRHGGDVDLPDFKPNYLSVMNDNFVYAGIAVADAPGSTTAIPCRVTADCPAEAICASFGDLDRTCTRIDYSRQALPTLNEASLDENHGIGAGTNDITAYACPDFTTGLGPGTGPIDWNCDGDPTETNVAADLNPDSSLTMLTGHRDWGTLNFHFQCFPGWDPSQLQTVRPEEAHEHPIRLKNVHREQR